MSVSAASLARVRLKVIPTVTATKATEGGATGGTDNSTFMTPLRTAQAIDARRPFASQPEAEAGADNTKTMTPLRTKQQVDARLVDQATAEAGTDNVDLMTSLRTKQQVDARLADQATAEAGADNTDLMTALRVAQSQAVISAPKSRAIGIASAPARPIAQITQDWVNAKEFLTFSGDEGAALNTAIAAMGSRSQLVLEGSVSTSIPIDITVADFRLQGVGGGPRKAVIVGSDVAQPIVLVNADRVHLDNLLVYGPSGSNSANVGVNWFGDDGSLSETDILNCYSGFQAQAAHNLQTHKMKIYGFKGYGLQSSGCIGGWHNKFNIIAGAGGDNTCGTLGGIRMVNQNESVNFTDGETLAGKYSLITASALTTIGNRNLLNMIVNVFFDGATDGSYCENMYMYSFVACEFSGGREGDTAGIRVVNGEAIDFDACHFTNCGRQGLNANGTKDLTIRGGQAFDNGKSATGQIGIDLYGVDGFAVLGVRTGNGIIGAYGPWPDGRQVYGVGVQTGCTNGRVRDCGNRGNLTGAVYQGVSASSTMVYADNF